MPNSTRVKPIEADAKRMSVRANGKTTLKIDSLPFAHALALSKPQSAVKTHEKPRVTVVPPSAIKAKKSSLVKPVRTTGKGSSNGVLRPPLPPLPIKKRPQVLAISARGFMEASQPKNARMPHGSSQPKGTHKVPANQKLNASSEPKRGQEPVKGIPKKPKRKSYSIKPFDGQSRFEGGYRIMQGGSPGQGKHR